MERRNGLAVTSRPRNREVAGSIPARVMVLICALAISKPIYSPLPYYFLLFTVLDIIMDDRSTIMLLLSLFNFIIIITIYIIIINIIIIDIIIMIIIIIIIIMIIMIIIIIVIIIINII